MCNSLSTSPLCACVVLWPAAKKLFVLKTLLWCMYGKSNLFAEQYIMYEGEVLLCIKGNAGTCVYYIHLFFLVVIFEKQRVGMPAPSPSFSCCFWL